MKLNIDGNSYRNLGPSRGGGIIRDENEKFMATFYRHYGTQSNLEVEAFALVDGLKLCRQLNLYELEVKSNSKLIC